MAESTSPSSSGSVDRRLAEVAHKGGSVTLRKLNCERCGHGPDWHSHDDSLNEDVTSPTAKFRCNGPDFKGCEIGCPDFVGEVFA